MNRMILASASPRRRTLLAQLGIRFEVMAGVQEEITEKTAPQEMAEELSLHKAKEICGRLSSAEEKERDRGEKHGPEGNRREPETTVVIGADTVVAFGDRVFGKPADEEDALRMLSLLQGNTHQVYTGVTIAVRRPGGPFSYDTFHETTSVTMYPVEKEELLSYIATGEPMDKAGAYGIQGRGAALIKEICGDYNNVVGLPLGRLYRKMKAGNLL